VAAVLWHMDAQLLGVVRLDSVPVLGSDSRLDTRAADLADIDILPVGVVAVDLGNEVGTSLLEIDILLEVDTLPVGVVAVDLGNEVETLLETDIHLEIDTLLETDTLLEIDILLEIDTLPETHNRLDILGHDDSVLGFPLLAGEPLMLRHYRSAPARIDHGAADDDGDGTFWKNL
jgi:hypothetical protein